MQSRREDDDAPDTNEMNDHARVCTRTYRQHREPERREISKWWFKKESVEGKTQPVVESIERLPSRSLYVQMSLD